MTDVTISALPVAVSVADSDLMVVVEIGTPNVTKRATAAQVRAPLLPLTGGTITGALTLNTTLSVGGASTFTGTATMNAGGGWSSSNVGKQLLLTTPAASSNPGIGLTDSAGTNLWALWNNGGTLNLSSMPAYSNSVTAPTTLAAFTKTSVAFSANTKITGTLESTGALTVDTGGATITAGGLTVTAGGAIVTTGGLTVSAGGAAVTGNSSITGALTISTNGTSGNQAVNFSQFDQTQSGTGHVAFPGGMFLQWGTAPQNGTGTMAVSFTPPFASAVYSIVATPISASSGADSVNVEGASKTGFTVHVTHSNVDVYWMAIGL